MTEAEQLAVPDWIHQLASQIVLGRHGVGNAGVLIQRAFEERLASELFQQRAAVELEHLAELQKLEERDRARWIRPKTIDDMPKKPGKSAYEYVPCLVFYRGELLCRPWNCEHQVFDDEAQDDHFCNWQEVTAYKELTPDFIALKDAPHD